MFKENIKVFETKYDVSNYAAKQVSLLIQNNDKTNKKTVLGLPTGSTPLAMYKELIRMHKEEGLSFKNVITFNLDEYYPISHNDPKSYHHYMNTNFLNHIDIDKSNVHLPRGNFNDMYVKQLPESQKNQINDSSNIVLSTPKESNKMFDFVDNRKKWLEDHCNEYEQKIKQYGGIQLMIVGIGRTGHIGFNEPNSQVTDRTRMVLLNGKTKKDAAGDFGGESKVPLRAITMGVATILDSDRIMLLANGEHKAKILRKALSEDRISMKDMAECPASYLRLHKNCEFVCDLDAGQYLTVVKAPWLYDPDIIWSDYLQKKAVVYLALKLKKSILKLTLGDFLDNGLTGLVLANDNDVHKLIHKIYAEILSCIHGVFPNQSLLPSSESDKILIFSPHPDDDVICMAGTMLKMLTPSEKRPDMKVAYMTNGSNAVDNSILKDHLRLFKLSSDVLFKNDSSDNSTMKALDDYISKSLNLSNLDANQFQNIQILKGNLRKTEAISAIEDLGLSFEDAKFLDLPFYKTGQVKKKETGEEDIAIVKQLLETYKPNHVFVAFDLTDPNDTHRRCYNVIREAANRIQNHGINTFWLYRGAWQEFDIEDISVISPLTKEEMDRKISSIFKHQSQKDHPLFPGDDQREFWVRARDRNIETAENLSILGFPSFFATEAFKRVKKLPN